VGLADDVVESLGAPLPRDDFVAQRGLAVGASSPRGPGIAGRPHSQPNPRYGCFLPDLTGFTRFVIERDPAIAAPRAKSPTLPTSSEAVNSPLLLALCLGRVDPVAGSAAWHRHEYATTLEDHQRWVRLRIVCVRCRHSAAPERGLHPTKAPELATNGVRARAVGSCRARRAGRRSLERDG